MAGFFSFDFVCYICNTRDDDYSTAREKAAMAALDIYPAD
jgi:hypothetical protein